MRYRGGGIGHKAMWDALTKISKEFHKLFEEDPNEENDPTAGGNGSTDEYEDLIHNHSDDEDHEDDRDPDSHEEDSDSDEGEDGGENEADTADLGPEDGEETWEDVLDTEGYAPL